MAQRKHFETNPPLDVSVADDTVKELHFLLPNELANLVQLIWTGSYSSVQTLAAGLRETAEKLHVNSYGADVLMPVPDLPHGNSDVMSIIVWSQKIGPRDRKAKAQLASLLSTLRQRGL